MKLIKTVLFVAFVGLAFVIGTILGGDKFGIGKSVGLVDKDGNITEESVNKFVDNTKDAIDEGKEKVQEAISSPTPTPHPYTTVTEIKITAGKENITFFSEPCADGDELEKKIIEAHTVNPQVTFVLDLSLASNQTAKTVKDVVEKQAKANGITYREE
ncbi:MAG: hypothetical protein K6F63_09345 [Lachnospiraceae bacterium]|nr:hypothetical protein [Lachnospiraceae bacterium]